MQTTISNPRWAVPFLTVIAILASAILVPAQPYRFEAETGQRVGTFVSSDDPGYSGTGYVTGFDSQTNSDYFTLQADVPAGLYELWVGFRSPFDEKGYNFQVAGEFGSGMFPQSSAFSVDRAGLFNLSGGPTTLGIYENWGYYDVDYLELRPFTPPAVAPVAPQLANPDADRPTRWLMNYLTSLYGKKTLAGHQHDESKNLPFPSSTYLNLSGGLRPSLRSSDFMEYSPSRIAHGANPRNESEQSIAWAKQNGGIVSMMWHWNAPTDLVDSEEWPWWSGFYTDATTFDLPTALANPASDDYQLLLRDIDAIAVELQKFEDAGVPVVWRPLHEAQGGWFWWGAHGPEAFKSLWRLTYDRLTNVHGLDNLIWEFTSSAAEGEHLEWYPGDDVVDIVGLDIYTDPSSSMSGQWYDVLDHYNGRKLIALSESGTLPNAELMETYDIEWSYFSLWKDQYLDDFSPAQVQALLSHSDIITLDELPALPWSNLATTLPGDYNLDGTVDSADYTVWRDSLGQAGDELAADGNGDGAIDDADYAIWKLYFGQSFAASPSQAASVPEPALLTLIVISLSCLMPFASRRADGILGRALRASGSFGR